MYCQAPICTLRVTRTNPKKPMQNQRLSTSDPCDKVARRAPLADAIGVAQARLPPPDETHRQMRPDGPGSRPGVVINHLIANASVDEPTRRRRTKSVPALSHLRVTVESAKNRR
jgi:hypothetical protein